MIAQKVFIQETLSSHVLGRRFEDSENGVGEYCWLSQIAFVGSVGFSCGGFNGLRKGSFFSDFSIAWYQEYTYSCWPNTRNRHPISPFSLPVHRKADRQHTHPDFPHSIRSLAPEEATINRRTDNDNSTLAIFTQVWQTRLDTTIKTFGVHLLHQLEAFHGRVGYA
jgi:hypothetical protein